MLWPPCRLIIKEDGFTEDQELRDKHRRESMRASADAAAGISSKSSLRSSSSSTAASRKRPAAFVKRDLDARARSDMFR